MGITAIKPLSIILTGDENWHDWIELVQTTADTANIWHYINPANANAKVLLEALKEPKYTDVHKAIDADTPVTFSDLTANEAQEYQHLQKDYKEIDKALRDMRAIIQASVHQNLFTHTKNCPKARDMLLNLKAEYCANPIIRERQLLAQYHKYKSISPNESIDKWLQNWKEAYIKCKEINASEVDNDKPLFDLIEALKSRMPGFYNV